MIRDSKAIGECRRVEVLPAVTPGSISVVTPTLRRPREVSELLDTLAAQTAAIAELVLVDAAPPGEEATHEVVAEKAPGMPFPIRHIRRAGGTAIQRNIGIDLAQSEFIAFIDDDMRLEPDFFAQLLAVFATDEKREVGGIAGYISNQHVDRTESGRWKWYIRLKLFTTYEAGRYDYKAGYPINRYLQPPHLEVREIDFMGTNCALWRRAVMDGGLRLSAFFVGYGVLEDAHFALRARRAWKLLECGRARCVHLHSPNGRENSRLVAIKTALNYRFVFMDIVPRRSGMQEFRFWRVQLFDLFRLTAWAVRKGGRKNWMSALGKLQGIVAAARLKQSKVDAMSNESGV